MSSNYNLEVGRRLKLIRQISNEGGPLSASQFAFLLDETRDRITNYERGVTSVPIRLLYKLFQRGINPIYLVTGEGYLLAENEQGIGFYEKISAKPDSLKRIFNLSPSLQLISESYLSGDKNKDNVPIYQVAAGDLHKTRKKRNIAGE